MLVKQQKSDVPASTVEEVTVGGLDACGVQRQDSFGDIYAAVATQVKAGLTATPAGSLPAQCARSVGKRSLRHSRWLSRQEKGAGLTRAAHK
jgi:hypothetical protein